LAYSAFGRAVTNYAGYDTQVFSRRSGTKSARLSTTMVCRAQGISMTTCTGTLNMAIFRP